MMKITNNLDERILKMILELRKSGILDDRIYNALTSVSRINFLPKNLIGLVNEDVNIEIFDGVIASKTSDIAKMLDIGLRTNPNTKNVLEIGTGSGWQTAILSMIYERVYTVEINEEAYLFSRNNLESLDKRIFNRLSDGKKGWIESSPFDVIYIDACCKNIPDSLIGQLCKNSGTIVFVKEYDKKHFFHSLSTSDNLEIIRSVYEVHRSKLI